MSNAFATLIGEAGDFATVIRAAQMIALTDATVLILGESGTGKELLARAIHQASRRQQASFVTINCAALPESLAESELFGHRKGAFTGADTHRQGRIQAAAGGTLFLDEIGELPLSIQAKLLRFLENGECQAIGKNTPDKVNVRVITATNRDLYAEMQAGHFRQDLYYRLNIVPLELPPLRQRKSDIKGLIQHFTQQFAQQHQRTAPSYSPATLSVLTQHEWAGNVRELRNLCERLVLFHAGQRLEPTHLPIEYHQATTPIKTSPLPFFNGFPDEGINLVEVEIMLIRQALTKTYGNCSQAARLLGLSRDTLLYRIKKYGIV
ncbi:response regulator with CheY-like receiver, AAA-type ATPase, and DNA-binding domains [Beggiatoa alba B18LD]|uniref:Response regulator with CheY-like receiver, AAA-type ATPase, and DNA-binding domains n=1 Tax=Beggiatoa alba B18LD TaxID=395493 RepID=I3CHJ3_9GAMM|nr:sigma-54 dependent transcriptional regulator [Beggiatoa alba]EIJ43086.1 response regulator with CheY-like receiver, AAA-type ATPase, and DNA-binding domains [Beggiatoa alba B18LD]